MPECYDCGKPGDIQGDDDNHYCEKCWHGEPRKVVRSYYNFYSTFVIPEGIDLESEDVKEWWVKWDTLCIEMKDGSIYRVSAIYSATEGDFKVPEKNVIEEETIDADYDESEHVTKN